MKLIRAMVSIEEINYKSFGKCVKIHNGIVEAVATLDIGPRIIRFAPIDGENVFFEDEGLTINHNDQKEVYEEYFGKGTIPWANIGGHRLWASPEALPKTYYPSTENKYEKIPNGIKIIAPVQERTFLQIEFEISFTGDNEVKVVNRLRNCGSEPSKFAVWCISVMAEGGTEIIPQPKRKTGLLHNRLIALWDYADMADKRVKWGNRYIRLKQDKKAETAFKIGINSESGTALYFNRGSLFVKKFDVVDNGNYPDGGMNFETYTNESFLEVESLGELKTVNVGESSEHIEYWKVFKGVKLPKRDKDIDSIIAEYV